MAISEDDINDAFAYAFRSAHGANGNTYWSFSLKDKGDEQLLETIKKETIGFFNLTFHKNMNLPEVRKSLSEEEKEKVVEFMKKRLKHYNENGFLVT